MIDLVRTWKSNTNANAVTITSGSEFTRTIVRAAVINNYEVALGADTQIEVEIEGDPAV